MYLNEPSKVSYQKTYDKTLSNRLKEKYLEAEMKEFWNRPRRGIFLKIVDLLIVNSYKCFM